MASSSALVVGGEVLQHRGAVVELHHLRLVLRPQRLHEARGGLLRVRSFSSMEAEVSIIRSQRDREVLVAEDRQVLLDAVLEDGEVGRS